MVYLIIYKVSNKWTKKAGFKKNPVTIIAAIDDYDTPSALDKNTSEIKISESS